MSSLKLAVGLFGMLMTNLALAGRPINPIPLPMEETGLLAVAAVLLVAGIRIARRKRDR